MPRDRQLDGAWHLASVLAWLLGDESHLDCAKAVIVVFAVQCSCVRVTRKEKSECEKFMQEWGFLLFDQLFAPFTLLVGW